MLQTRMKKYLIISGHVCGSFMQFLRINKESQSAKNLIKVVLNKVNSFDELIKDRITLVNRVCDSNADAKSVDKVDSLGQKQCHNFRWNVLDTNDTALKAPRNAITNCNFMSK